MFTLQVEVHTDPTPNRTSWELSYDSGQLINHVGQDTYTEENSFYNHTYCVDTSCFVFNLFDSFAFQGSYNIIAGDIILAHQDSFLGWKNSKQFCHPLCSEDGMFALQIELTTDDWPHEIFWELAFDNGTLVDHVDKRYYTERNKFYSHRYCLEVGCYSVTFHDHIGDGFCCSYGEGSYQIKINNDEIIKKGGQFGESETSSFCYPFDDEGCEGCEDKSLVEKILNFISG